MCVKGRSVTVNAVVVNSIISPVRQSQVLAYAAKHVKNKG